MVEIIFFSSTRDLKRKKLTVAKRKTLIRNVKKFKEFSEEGNLAKLSANGSGNGKLYSAQSCFKEKKNTMNRFQERRNFLPPIQAKEKLVE